MKSRWARRGSIGLVIVAAAVALKLTVFKKDAVPVTVFRVAKGKVEATVTNSKATGTEIAKAIDRGDIDAELVAVCDRSSKCVEQLIWSLENKPAKADIIELVNLSDIIVEAASQSAVPMVARAALKKGKSLMIMSVGALANVEYIAR